MNRREFLTRAVTLLGSLVVFECRALHVSSGTPNSTGGAAGYPSSSSSSFFNLANDGTRYDDDGPPYLDQDFVTWSENGFTLDIRNPGQGIDAQLGSFDKDGFTVNFDYPDDAAFWKAIEMSECGVE